MLKKLLQHDPYYNSIPNDDLIAKQRYKLFRTTSIVGTLACFLFVVQDAATYSFSHPVVILTSIIGTIFFINLALLPVHKKKSCFLYHHKYSGNVAYSHTHVLIRRNKSVSLFLSCSYHTHGFYVVGK